MLYGYESPWAAVVRECRDAQQRLARKGLTRSLKDFGRAIRSTVLFPPRAVCWLGHSLAARFGIAHRRWKRRGLLCIRFDLIHLRCRWDVAIGRSYC